MLRNQLVDQLEHLAEYWVADKEMMQQLLERIDN